VFQVGLRTRIAEGSQLRRKFLRKRTLDGNPFDGGKTYHLTVPANPPVE
jgi:hypothetical protein